MRTVPAAHFPADTKPQGRRCPGNKPLQLPGIYQADQARDQATEDTDSSQARPLTLRAVTDPGRRAAVLDSVKAWRSRAGRQPGDTQKEKTAALLHRVGCRVILILAVSAPALTP